jgi:hypothetical protein
VRCGPRPRRLYRYPFARATLHKRMIETNGRQVENAVKAIIFVLLSSAAGFSETLKQLGGWSVYPASDHVEFCRSHFLRSNIKALVALEPRLTIQGTANVLCTGPVPATRVNLSMDGQAVTPRPGCVGCHTLASNSELLKGKLMRHWVSTLQARRRWLFRRMANLRLSPLLPPVSSRKPRRRFDAVTNRPAVVGKEVAQI